ncbi:hypothetical protein HMPREF0880_04409 [Yokenella regensburgei ATCC 43003]|nr:hypothetical protein HMPREF0880_04409 [Yokenella regensburgei ATCC 43003]
MRSTTNEKGVTHIALCSDRQRRFIGRCGWSPVYRGIPRWEMGSGFILKFCEDNKDNDYDYQLHC